MLYWLTEFSDGGDVFNLFRYITFRAGGAFMTALIFGFIFGLPLINVLRRKQGAKDLLPQITGFSGRKPLVVDAIRGILARDNARIPTWGQFADLDFDVLGARLTEGGFLPDPAAWTGLNDWRRARLRRTYEQRLECRFTDLGPEGEPIPAAV